jgi:hypothetical protein
MTPYVPKYVSPKQAAEERARRRALLFRIALAVPLVFALLMFGYSDQAPTALREMTIGLDRTFGYPVLWLIGVIGRGVG